MSCIADLRHGPVREPMDRDRRRRAFTVAEDAHAAVQRREALADLVAGHRLDVIDPDDQQSEEVSRWPRSALTAESSQLHAETIARRGIKAP